VRYMLDTDTCISITRDASEAVVSRLIEVGSASIVISAITVAELQYGVENSAKKQRVSNQQVLSNFLKTITLLPWPPQAAKGYAEIRATLKESGNMIGANDLLIAAHARYEELIIVTNNVREFSRVPGLTYKNWMHPA